MSECKLLSDAFSYLIQIFLGLVAISSLVYKRYLERPQRPWKIWGFDVGKQLVGGFFVHLGNIAVSSYILNKAGGDECAWYFINFFVDCTLGVGIVYVSHKLICEFVIYVQPHSVLAHIGDYHDPPEIKIWVIQLIPYILSLIINKVIIVSFLYGLEDPMTYFGNWLFGAFRDNPQGELVVVMILCPWLLTTLQFWLFDKLLKAKVISEKNYDELRDGNNEEGNLDKSQSDNSQEENIPLQI